MSEISSAYASGGTLGAVESMLWVGDIARVGAERCPERTATVFAENGRRLTYAQLDSYSRAFAALVQQRGLSAGDRIGWLARNDDLYYVAMIGAALSGVVLVPINWRLSPPEVAYQLEDAGAAWLLADPGIQALADAANALLPSPLPVDRIDPSEGTGLWQQLQSCAPLPPAEPRHDREQTLLQVYTSGTTGKPKGVLISHFALSMARHAELQSPDWDYWTEGGISLSAMPNFHMGGLSWVLMGLVRFATVVISMDPGPANMLALMRRYQVDYNFIVPTVIRSIVDELLATGADVPPTKAIYYGAMSMDAGLLKQTMGLFGCRFGHFFGMTEVTGAATFLPPDQHDPACPERLRSVGRPYMGMEFEIRDPQWQVMSHYEHGEIWIKTPTLMQGYWNKPEQTAEVVVDGWYATGDGGYMDPEGYVFLTDRIKDMIVTGGENVYPVEVESALLQHPAVLSAAVIGIPDPQWGEMVAAVIELREGQYVDEATLRSFVRGHLAGFKCPRRILFGPLPRTGSGKIQRGVLRERLRTATPV